jgi:hypothetical protein
MSATGLFVGLVAGAVGAAAWAALAYFTGYEVGYVAWGIGLLVGSGVFVGGGRTASTTHGAAAVAITLVAIAGGKYAATHFVFEKVLHAALVEHRARLENEEFLISCKADEVVGERTQAGTEVAWPAGVDPNEAAKQEDYPGDVWTEAVARWGALSPAERQQYKGELDRRYAARLDRVRPDAERNGFRRSFGILDILFLALAVGSAWKIGAGLKAAAPSAA